MKANPKGTQASNPSTKRQQLMRMVIVSGDLRLSEAMRDYLNWRARFALGRLAAVLRDVRISLRDENGFRGGGQRRCRVVLYPLRGRAIVVEASGGPLKPLVDRTLARASRTLARAVKHAAVRPLEPYTSEPKPTFQDD